MSEDISQENAENKQKQAIRKLPSFFVGYEISQKRIEDYKVNKYPGICEQMAQLRKKDTLSVWYEKEHIQALLEEIEHYDCNGVKICLGTYEKGHLYAGQTCLIFQLTKKPEGKSPIDFEQYILENKAPDWTERAKESGLEIAPDGKIQGLRLLEDFNFGRPCPPKCDEAGTGGGG